MEALFANYPSSFQPAPSTQLGEYICIVYSAGWMYSYLCEFNNASASQMILPHRRDGFWGSDFKHSTWSPPISAIYDSHITCSQKRSRSQDITPSKASRWSTEQDSKKNKFKRILNNTSLTSTRHPRVGWFFSLVHNSENDHKGASDYRFLTPRRVSPLFSDAIDIVS